MKRFASLIFIFFILIGATLIWWTNGLQAVNTQDTSEKMFVVRKGAGVREIANDLKEQRLIKDPIVFFLTVKRLQLDNKIQAGDHRLSPSMNAEKIANTLTHGTVDVWVTIPEGLRAEEIANILQKDVPSYDISWKDELIKQQGYLFPDTYLIPKDATAQQVISILTNTFEQKYAMLKDTARSGLTKAEIVIVASLVEREARLGEDRPLVASVILNRLNIGMKLDIDATLQYALGYQVAERRWWKRSLTNADKTIRSPYNTYTNPGLPPGPIANPGLAAMQAVVSPAKTNYLYYISDSKGKNHYATTIEGHEENKQKYGL